MTEKFALTRRQQETLDAILTYRTENGVSPTVREIMELIGAKSLGHASSLLDAIQERGYITRLPGKARSITPATDDSRSLEALRKTRDAAVVYLSAQQNFRGLFEGSPTSPETVAAGKIVGKALENLRNSTVAY